MRPRGQTWHGSTVLLPGGPVLVNLVLRRGKIRKIVPVTRPAPGSRFEQSMAGYLVLPGLVNAHDHFHFNCYPAIAPNRPYTNANQWYEDVRSAEFAPTLRAVRSIPLKYRLLASGFKNLLAGATSVVHHDSPARLLYRRRFPVTVPRRVGYCHSLSTEPHPEKTLPTKQGRPWTIHVAEGTDDTAARELARLDELGCLRPGSVLVHCLGIDPGSDPARLSAAGAGAVWCPTSNRLLYDAVAPVRRLLEQTAVALGTDSAISGGGTMLDELREARRAEPELSRQTLLEMATIAGARLFGLAPGRGAIVAGSHADVALFRLPPAAEGADPLSAPFDARHPALVVRGGIPLVGDASFHLLMEALRLDPVEFQLDGEGMVMPRRLYKLFARTVQATAGRPPFGDRVALH